MRCWTRLSRKSLRGLVRFTNAPEAFVDPYGLHNVWAGVSGAFRMVGGAAGGALGLSAAGVGGTATAGTAGLASPVSVPAAIAGTALTVYSFDQFATGWQEVWRGDYQQSTVSAVVEKGTGNHNAGEAADAVIGILGPAAVGRMASSGLRIVPVVIRTNTGAISATGELGKSGASACPAEAGNATVTFTWQEVKEIIKGLAHNSGLHKFQVYREAIPMAKSGKYTTIYLNKSLKTVTGGAVDSLLRPDIAGVLENGTIDLIEIVSPSQKARQLEMKIDTMSTILGPLSGPIRKVVEIKNEMPK